MQAMLQMGKIEIKALEDAANAAWIERGDHRPWT